MALELENIDNLVTDDLDLRNRNWTTIDDSLELKADKTYVDSQDELKADKSDTYTKTEVDTSLDLKADKTYVDNQDTALTTHMAESVTQVDGVHGLVVASGTWTPSFGGNDVLGTANYTILQGSYVRIANLVYITATLRLSTLTGGAGYYMIDGLPYPPSEVAPKYYLNVAQNIASSATTIADVYAGKIWLRVYNGTGAVAYADITAPKQLDLSGWYRI